MSFTMEDVANDLVKNVSKGGMQADADRVMREFSAKVESAVADKVEQRLKAFLDARTEGGEVAGVSTASKGQIRTTEKTTARVMMALATERYTRENVSAKEVAAKNWPGDESVDKALSLQDPAEGGALIPEGYHNEIVGPLKPYVVMRRLEPRYVPMPETSLTVPVVAGGTTAQYVGEESSPVASGLKTGARRLNSKELVTLVPVPNLYLKAAADGRSGAMSEAFIQETAIEFQGIREDMAFIRDKGGDHTPKGVRWWAPPQNVISASGGQGFVNVLGELGRLMTVLEDADVPMVRPSWILRPRTKNFLMFQAISDGRPFFLTMMMAGELLGFPFGATSQIPGNLDVGGEAKGSEIIFLDMNQIMLGEAVHLQIDTSGDATFKNGKGETVSAFAKNMTVLRVVSAHDLVPKHDEAIAVLKDVTWGA